MASNTELDRRSALRLSAAVGLGAVLAACTGQDKPPAGPDRLMFIRHGEEPDANGDSGVTQDGKSDPRSLSVHGWSRAGALVALFDPRDADGKPLPTRAGLDRPTRIFAPEPGQSNSRRSWETVLPLAASLNLQVDLRFAPKQTAQLAGALAAVPGPVLVAWKHEHIAEIISHLSGVTPPPPSWPEGRYDVIYVLTRSGGGWSFSQQAQMLLAEDRPV